MSPATKNALLTASQSIESGLQTMATAYAAYMAALVSATAEASQGELAIMGAQYGQPALVQACQQSMGAKALLPVLAGNPQVIGQVGVQKGGSVYDIMNSRLIGF